MPKTPNSSNKRKSNVWEHYTKDSEKDVTCLICNKQLKHSGNTTNLWLHLKRKHATYLTTENVLQQTNNVQNARIITTADGSILSAVLSISPDDQQVEVVLPDHPSRVKTPKKSRESKIVPLGKPKKVDRLLVEMICIDLQPISIVEFTGFRKLVNVIDPRYIIPTKETVIEKLFPAVYTDVRNTVEKCVQNAKYIAITTDHWTSSIHDTNFMSVTAHFILNSKLNNFVIATEIITCYNAETISKTLQTTFSQWNLDNSNIVCLISNNDNEMEEAARLLGIHHLPCVAHSIHLVVSDALEGNPSLNEIREMCRNLVSYFTCDPSATSKFNDVQQSMKGTILKLKQENYTQWRSTFVMFSRLLQTRVSLTTVLPFIYQAPPNMTSEQWQIIEDCLALLKPLDMLSTELSKESFPIVSRIIPLVEGTQNVINNYCPKTNAGSKLKADLLTGYSKRLCNYERMNGSAIATILDPRLKKFAFSTDENASAAIATIKTEIENNYKFHNEQLPPVIEIELATSEETEQEQDESSIWDFFKRKSTSHTETNETSVSKANDEIRRYMSMPLVDIKSDPLLFWESEKMIFEYLGDLAHKYLCVPALAVPSERLFTKAGQLANEQRNRLTPLENEHLMHTSKQGAEQFD